MNIVTKVVDEKMKFENPDRTRAMLPKNVLKMFVPVKTIELNPYFPVLIPL